MHRNTPHAAELGLPLPSGCASAHSPWVYLDISRELGHHCSLDAQVKRLLKVPWRHSTICGSKQQCDIVLPMSSMCHIPSLLYAMTTRSYVRDFKHLPARDMTSRSTPCRPCTSSNKVTNRRTAAAKMGFAADKFGITPSGSVFKQVKQQTL